MNKKNVKRGLLPYVFLILSILVIYYVFNMTNVDVNKLTYSEFLDKHCQ